MFKHCMFGIRQNAGVYVEGLKDPPQLISTCFGIISDFYDRGKFKRSRQMYLLAFWTWFTVSCSLFHNKLICMCS